MSERVKTLVEQAFKLAYTERMNELRGVHVKRWDSRGLHPYSVVWGQIIALENGEAQTIGPVKMREIARASADLDHHKQQHEEADDIRTLLEERLVAAKGQSPQGGI